MSTLDRVRPTGRRRRAQAPARPPAPVRLDVLQADWRTALETAGAALTAARSALPAGELAERGRLLAVEREQTTQLLQALARDFRRRDVALEPMLESPEARRRLGLPQGVHACVFSVDGVLVGSTAVHVEAWREAFDKLLRRLGGLTWRMWAELVPFDPEREYVRYVHGRSRLDGVRTFLASRGISLPEGGPGDPPDAQTVHGVANHKQLVFQRLLETREIEAYQASRRYLELLHDAHYGVAVVTTSAHARAVLERAGLAALVDVWVDADAVRADHLRPRPAPDMYVQACRALGVAPAEAAVFETSPDGIAAARAAGFRLTVGVDREQLPSHATALRGEGADLVVTGLDDLLEQAPAAAAA